MKSRFALPLAVILSVLPFRCFSQGDGKPVVGAIYWPGWTDDTKWANNLKPPEWNNRLPFYAEVSSGTLSVRSDNQATMDQEIKYASAAGLDYIAFDYSPNETKAAFPLY